MNEITQAAFFDELEKISGAKRYARLMAAWGKREAKTGKRLSQSHPLVRSADRAHAKLMRSMEKRKQIGTGSPLTQEMRVSSRGKAHATPKQRKEWMGQ
jgi:hypothetical protein